MSADERSFKDLADIFLAHMLDVRGLSVHTVRGYGADISSFNEWAKRTGTDPLTMTHRTLRLYLGELDGAQYARTTIARKMACLRALFSFLNDEGYIEGNPTVLLTTPKLAKRLPKALPAKDINTILESVDTSTPEGIRDSALLELLYASGIRVAEVSSLTLGSLHKGSGVIKVMGKGSKERLVPLHPLAISKLEHYLDASRPALACRMKDSSTDCTDSLDRGRLPESLFLSTRGNPLSTDAIRRIVKKCAVQAGISSKVSPHTFRHSFASDLLGEGADLRSVQELLGHANLSTTQIYTHVSPAKLKEVHRQAHPRG